MCVAVKEWAQEERTIGRTEGRKEGRAEGRSEGRTEGIIETYAHLVKDGTLSIDTAVKKTASLGVTSEEDFKSRAKLLGIEL